jgi:hypothetical protein
VPALLLGLTSTSAATYTLNKALQSAKPVVQAVVPSHLRAGTVATVTGRYLFAVDGPATVKIGGVAVELEKAASSGSTGNDIGTFTAPANLPDGMQPLTVVTAAAIETDTYSVLCEAPTIIGWSGAAALQGKPAALRLSTLPDVGSPAYLVAIDHVSVPANADPSTGTLSFDLPPSVAAGTHSVTVYADQFVYATAQLDVH